MNSLFLYPSDGGRLDGEAILDCFQSLNGLSEFEMEPDEFSLCSARFEFEGESNMIELKRSLEVLILGREGKAALKLAFDIQVAYPNPLNVTNESFSFELCVSDFCSFSDFQQRFFAELESY
jgi:hypothetical protein